MQKRTSNEDVLKKFRFSVSRRCNPTKWLNTSGPRLTRYD